MTQQFTNELFCDYYERWIEVYKQDAVRSVTMGKYRMTHKWLVRLVPTLQLKDIDRIAYQRLLNAYAAEHERQTVMDFHHQVKGAILDAVDDGLIPRDPTRKAVIKGKTPRVKKENESKLSLRKELVKNKAKNVILVFVGFHPRTHPVSRFPNFCSQLLLIHNYTQLPSMIHCSGLTPHSRKNSTCTV